MNYPSLLIINIECFFNQNIVSLQIFSTQFANVASSVCTVSQMFSANIFERGSVIAEYSYKNNNLVNFHYFKFCEIFFTNIMILI